MSSGKSNFNKVIAISGATATGKTDVALAIARKISAEIINFDSLQFYQEIEIGTALPSREERDSLPHHLFAFRSIDESLNAADFSRLALPIIQEIHLRQKPVILVGGSGFYLKALLQGMYESPTSGPEILEKSELLYKTEGIAPFLQILEKVDPTNFKKLHPNDHYRIMRAVEHYWSTGEAFSKAKEKKEQEDSKDNIHDWNLLHINLQVEKNLHWEIMQKRVVKMIEQGLIEEVKNLLALGFSPDLRPLRAIGYKETIDFLQGKINSQEELIEQIYVNTRRLAKSQKTWFATSHPKEVFWVPQEQEKAVERALEFFAS